MHGLGLGQFGFGFGCEFGFGFGFRFGQGASANFRQIVRLAELFFHFCESIVTLPIFCWSCQECQFGLVLFVFAFVFVFVFGFGFGFRFGAFCTQDCNGMARVS